MFEKVGSKHPDKIADRIAGAIVDLERRLFDRPKCAVEVLIGHGVCHIMNETDYTLHFRYDEIVRIVNRIAGGNMEIEYLEYKQDERLAENQRGGVRCGDNGVFRGMPVTPEQSQLDNFARLMDKRFGADGKFVLDNARKRLVVCQSNATEAEIREFIRVNYPLFDYDIVVNPLGDWTGGTDVDCGATNRKLGSDMADSATGGGLHGKDLSKGDVSINIYAWLKAQAFGVPIELSCAIGDEVVDDRPYHEIVEIAEWFVDRIGGFEKLAEYGYPLSQSDKIAAEALASCRIVR